MFVFDAKGNLIAADAPFDPVAGAPTVGPGMAMPDFNQMELYAWTLQEAAKHNR